MKKYGFLILTAFIFVLIFSMGSENTKKKNIIDIRGQVMKVDNSNVVESGIIKLGCQELIVKIIEGNYSDNEIKAINLLSGKMDMDNFYKEGDKLIVGARLDDGKIVDARAIDHYRQGYLFLMFGIFSVLLISFAKFIGFRALISFIASLLVIWKFYIPELISGKDPILYTFFSIIFLSIIIMLSVAGFSKKAIVAIFGTIFGLLTMTLFTILFGNLMNLHGMTTPFAETLLFRGYFNLNMREIFYSSIIVGASGAAMDIAMDIAASMEEIKYKKPEISRKELLNSGFNIGRSVIGTMTTTLLLAYSGGYLTLLMVFYSQNSSIGRMLNMKIVSAEIMRIVIGSIGLVLVAPITAIFGSYIYCNVLKSKKNEEKEIIMD